MWIRSQDKEILINANIFFIENILSLNDEIEYGIKTISAANLRAILGKYSTKEKALKVLDMIQDHIAGKITITTVLVKGADGNYMVVGNNNLEETIKRSVPTTFDMPQDNEVEME